MNEQLKIETDAMKAYLGKLWDVLVRLAGAGEGPIYPVGKDEPAK